MPANRPLKSVDSSIFLATGLPLSNPAPGRAGARETAGSRAPAARHRRRSRAPSLRRPRPSQTCGPISGMTRQLHSPKRRCAFFLLRYYVDLKILFYAEASRIFSSSVRLTFSFLRYQHRRKYCCNCRSVPDLSQKLEPGDHDFLLSKFAASFMRVCAFSAAFSLLDRQRSAVGSLSEGEKERGQR